MASVTVTSVATGLTISNHAGIVENLFGGWMLKCDAYQVAIELSVGDITDSVRSSTSDSFVYPPAHCTRPKNLSARGQTVDGDLSHRALLSTFGKTIPLSTYDDTTSTWAPTNGEYALMSTYTFTDGNGSYG